MKWRVWDVTRRRFIDIDALFAEIVHARFLLLGEIHTNADHHKLQALLLARLIKMKRCPTVCFEMLDTTAQTKIDKYLAQKTRSAAGFGKAVGWDLQWNPEYSMYRPIFDVAIPHRLKIVAANSPKSEVKRVVQEGIGILPQAIVSNLPGLTKPFPRRYREALAQVIWAAHFGNTPIGNTPNISREMKKLRNGMVEAQRLRDAAMAAALLKTDSNKVGVLIAGNGHVRVDGGVPYYLRDAADSAAIVSVGLLEEANNRLDNLLYDFACFVA
ncbi:hypothetical protein A2926_02995 [Candidatus Giovannonibacteria bacterium RIFCSPLOWO2_01_FULL_44_40]|uniref:Haem-binding uptake Tiki superfamily ChaN domain-containing protein n=1 Tax=Candidatus Giovannonibacteria bacterium RIFCSPHIGHO2_01_FULL_45_23 TaxID=1798325 RepID=A0A1F5VJA9_9BACT|nr:MAG: hypothetical protein A2834_04510 [Candidatus Giovannonibacteria bacterium RIFCSPHIGHO2_01_FULL_45_23]OGF75514.1 MAG: hypothetical protein A3C77_01465 [Candidatus Giovannonibacteria bacterium RIFCSPHIGHO2_02_FULL_45_13]OGF80387.1 MAG: hypothetical protein A2926_02995 [Candidatus Giovannonibacteria bacterium RIFCSPLOWO2_01_FULL_44_40]